MSGLQGKKLILLDRDGVMNRDRPDSVKSIAEFELLDGVALAIARLNQSGFRVVVVTNQAVVGRGVISAAILSSIHQEMERRLWQEAGGRLDRILVATDAPSPSGDWRETPRRKPGPQMLCEAMAEFGMMAAETLMVGDSFTDLQAALRAGCDFWLVETGKGAEVKARLTSDPPCPEFRGGLTICRDLTAVVDRLLGE
ncbi:MAG: HAD-IIIA family hydrolase [Alphaproteobacteria bacterium]|nr:HAD-IIIA family hydrolase [Alphaproteobacteria bacterium]